MGRRRSHSLGLFYAQVKKKGKTLFESERKSRYVWNISFGMESMENGLEKYPNSSLLCVVFG